MSAVVRSTVAGLVTGLFICVSLSGFSAHAHAADTQCRLPESISTIEFQDWVKRAKELPRRYWRPYLFPADRYGRIEIEIDYKSGMPLVKLTSSTWTVEGDASCLEAGWNSCMTAPAPAVHYVLPPPPVAGQSPPVDSSLRLDEEFYAEDIGEKFSGAKDYYLANPEQSEKTFALHAVPLCVLDRYPGLFSDDQLNAKDNVIFLEKDKYRYERDIRVFFQYWYKFFKEHPRASREDVLAQALKEMKQPMIMPDLQEVQGESNLSPGAKESAIGAETAAALLPGLSKYAVERIFKIGETAYHKHDFKGAKANFDSALLSIDEELQTDPNAEWAKSSKLSVLKLYADMDAINGNRKEALRKWKLVQELAEALCSRHPNNETYLISYASACANRVSRDASLSSQDKIKMLDSAVKRLQSVLFFASTRPHALGLQGRLLSVKASSLRRDGNNKEALAYMQQARNLAEEALAGTFSGNNRGPLKRLAWVLVLHADWDIRDNQGAFVNPEAHLELERAEKIAIGLLEKDPKDGYAIRIRDMAKERLLWLDQSHPKSNFAATTPVLDDVLDY